MNQPIGRPGSRPAVMVLDPTTRHSVAVVRGLGRAGWRVVVAGHEPVTAVLAPVSRYAASYHRIPSPWRAAAPFASSVRRLAERHRCAAVVACSDSTIARLRGLDIGIPTMPHMDRSLDRLTDKHELARVCAEAGVRYPPSWLADNLTEPPESWPLIIKPRRTAVATSERVVSRTGAIVAPDPGTLRAGIAALQDLGLEVLIQRRVDRRFKVNVSLVRRAGITSFHIAYRVVREYPPEGGLAATIETLSPTHGVGERALAAAARVCDAARYAGLANVEFYGQADGELCLIEVNPRVWGSIWLPEELGLEPASRAVADAIGAAPRSPLGYAAGVRFHRPTLELRWLVSRSPERGSRIALLRSIRPSDVFDVVSFSDPLPPIYLVGQVVMRAVAAAWRRLIRSHR
jgi:predicted ATP-grasp superfamily ATP-dependent carboligase